MSLIKIKRALISVSDKECLVDFARFLVEKGVEIISTGGTLKAISGAGIPVRAVEEITGFPEMMDGRLKTLHPKIHGGLLALEDNPGHRQDMEEHGIEGIELLVVNLYPFAETIASGESDLAKIVEQIDIGGPTMLRAAAKNYRFTTAVCQTADYERVMREIAEKGGISEELSLELSRAVFNHTASYDAMIAGHLNERAGDKFPETLTVTYQKSQPLRYGENPHQEGCFYRPALDIVRERKAELEGLVQLHGKELSYNNILDLGSALECVMSLPGPGAVIVKHLNPCGAAVSTDPGEMDQAFLAARACDPVSAFGGVIAVSAMVDRRLAELITEQFAEAVIAPEYTDEAMHILFEKKNLRVMCANDSKRFIARGMEIRQALGGVLYQEADRSHNRPADWKCVTEKKPNERMLEGFEFAWRMVKYVKSNAIIFCSGSATLGIGAGQMSRVDSVEIAVSKAAKNKIDLRGSIVASDAFFPFRDGIDALAAAGAKAVIQPGGSVRDQEAIDACNENGIVMMFTGMRHFRH